jgi:hypothetical protein
MSCGPHRRAFDKLRAHLDVMHMCAEHVEARKMSRGQGQCSSRDLLGNSTITD